MRRGATLKLVASCAALALCTTPTKANSNQTSKKETIAAIKELIASQELEKGLAMANSLIKKDENDNILYFLKGRVLQEQKKNLEAFQAYSIAIFLRPDMTKAYINRGLIRGALMDLNGAVEDFNSALRLEPKNQAALVNRGVTYASLNNISKAVEDLDKAVSLNRSLTEAYVNRGIIRHLAGEKSRSCEDWTKAARLGSQDASQWAKQLCSP
jgi:tetratricopeptide (TPR) repeat protein